MYKDKVERQRFNRVKFHGAIDKSQDLGQGSLEEGPAVEGQGCVALALRVFSGVWKGKVEERRGPVMKKVPRLSRLDAGIGSGKLRGSGRSGASMLADLSVSRTAGCRSLRPANRAAEAACSLFSCGQWSRPGRREK